MKRASRISDAKTLCRELGARAVVVIALDRDNVSVSSYGETTAECREVRRLNDAIADGIGSGDLWMWGGR